MNGTLLAHTWRSQRARFIAVALALAAWGALLPVIYAAFGAEFRRLFEGGVFGDQLSQFSEFGGGDVLSLPGSIALGFIHPIAVALLSVFAVGFASSAIAGERQRGTLEVLLSRPISRRSLFLTLFVAVVLFLGLGVAAMIAGNLLGAALSGVLGELELARVPLLWLNGVLLFLAFGSIGLAASASFDRLTPALGLTVAILLVSYFLDIIGSLWPDAAWLQPYSLFNYLPAKQVLTEGPRPLDLALLAAVAAIAVGYALFAFPKRDIAAPS